MRRFTGITLRFALFGWAVTLLTLLVFVFVTLPQQKREYQAGLESKAQSIAASLSSALAGAAVSGDYTSLVDQSLQVLEGDLGVEFLVLVRNDGYAVVAHRHGWRIEWLDDRWTPETRVRSGGIENITWLGRRVYHFSAPFDYSGLAWGWTHVGLSLADYDRGVKNSYIRTAKLALACGLLSLFLSMIFARRMLRPVRALHSAVARVSEGDLEARAEVQRKDEIGELAHAFNEMGRQLLARNRILEGVAYAAQLLLTGENWTKARDSVVGQLGKACQACFGGVLELEADTGTEAPIWRLQWVWRQNGQATPNDSLAVCLRDPAKTAVWEQAFARQETVVLERSRLTADQQKCLPPGAESLAGVPMVAGDLWRGFLILVKCTPEADWSQAEISSLRAVADMLGAALLRAHAQEELLESKQLLEVRVAERTQELERQVAEKEQARKELVATQHRLLELSRQSGMAEVATGVLHNVGNVLNSINVAASLLSAKLKDSRIIRLQAAAGLLEEHSADLCSFLSSDPKGRLIPSYLVKLSGYLLEERKEMLAELERLDRYLEHIKEVVAAQQSYARLSGFIQRVDLRGLIEDALMISRTGLERDDIQVRVEGDEIPEVETDKHKVLQILLNLIRNARDAVRLAPSPDKRVEVRLLRCPEDRVRIEVRDNGVGLSPDVLPRVFEHGYTTKAGGHGFGLHSAALAAKELGGRLSASSPGIDQGASFALELPLRTN